MTPPLPPPTIRNKRTLDTAELVKLWNGTREQRAQALAMADADRNDIRLRTCPPQAVTQRATTE